MVVVLMGVSGSGKTTIGLRLADTLAAEFAEGDDFHPPANVEKMRAGTPLTDEDRNPWLETLSRKIGDWLDADTNGVLACSALKASYRDVLRGERTGVYFVHLKGSEPLLRARLELRRGHYMPPSLLASQLASLEEPADAIVADISGTPDAIAANIIGALGPEARAAAGVSKGAAQS
jgi:gluconokinase